MPEYKSGRFHMRRYTTAEWAALDPVLGDGEPGYDEDTHALKIGDGHTPWSGLEDYAGPAGPQGEQGPKGQDGAATVTLADNSLINTGTTTNPVLKVGDLSGTYASATELQTLSDQQGQLMGVAATTDELTVSLVVAGAWISGTWTQDAGANLGITTLWIAQYACQVTAAQLMSDYSTIASDSTDYVTVGIHRVRAGVVTPIVVKSTADDPLTARTAWDFAGADWDTGVAVLQAGDGLALGSTVNGAATLKFPIVITATVQPT